MNNEQVKQAFIDFYYEGDTDEFTRRHPLRIGAWQDRYFEADVCLRWRDIETSLKSPTGYAAPALELLRYHLGYQPASNAYIPYDGFLSSLLANYASGNLSTEQLFKEYEYYARLILVKIRIRFKNCTKEIPFYGNGGVIKIYTVKIKRVNKRIFSPFFYCTYAFLPLKICANPVQIRKQLCPSIITASLSAPPSGLEPETL